MTRFIEYINSEKVPGVPPLSHAVCSGEFVFVSGQVGLRSEDGRAPDHFSDEVENAFTALEHVLIAAGSSPDHLVKVTCYLSDIANRDELNELYMKRFAAPRPARTTVEVGLAHGLKFEVDAIATRARL